MTPTGREADFLDSLIGDESDWDDERSNEPTSDHEPTMSADEPPPEEHGPYGTRREAIAGGRHSNHCNPRLITAEVRELRRMLTRAQLVEALVQRGVSGVLTPGPAMLLLQVVAHLADQGDAPKVRGLKGHCSSETPTAWIGRRTLAALADRHRSTIDRHAGKITKPFEADGLWFPSLFTMKWQSPILTHWVPLDNGWQSLIWYLEERRKTLADELYRTPEEIELQQLIDEASEILGCRRYALKSTVGARLARVMRKRFAEGWTTDHLLISAREASQQDWSQMKNLFRVWDAHQLRLLLGDRGPNHVKERQ